MRFDVVRGTAVGNANVLAVFGKNGYLCSTDARPLIAPTKYRWKLSYSARFVPR